MRTVLTLLGVLFVSCSALANQATDTIRGAVTCESKGGSFAVEISAKRDVMTIRSSNGDTRTYRVTQTVGDTQTWYAPASGYPSLSFNDQGDFISFNSTRDGVLLDCPQGQEQTP